MYLKVTSPSLSLCPRFSSALVLNAPGKAIMATIFTAQFPDDVVVKAEKYWSTEDLQFEPDIFATENSPAPTSSEGDTPAPEQPLPVKILRFTDGETLPGAEKTSFKFGTKPDSCDVVIEGRCGVSAIHFEIVMDWKLSALVLFNHSRRLGTQVRSENIKPTNLRTQTALVDTLTIISFSGFDVQITKPWKMSVPGHEGEGVPDLAGINLRSSTLSSTFSAFDLYTFGQTLGKGSFGVVVHAHHRKTGAVFAAKQFKEKIHADPWKESGLLFGLNHVCFTILVFLYIHPP